jgi:hypothetical protein
VGAHAREIALVGAGEAVEQQPRDGQVQHGVAKELEPLVVVGAKLRCVRARSSSARLREHVAQALLDDHRRADGRRRDLLVRHRSPLRGRCPRPRCHAVVLDEQVHGLDDRQLDVVGEARDEALAVLGDLEILAADRLDRVLDLLALPRRRCGSRRPSSVRSS